MLERYFLRPQTVDRIRASWLSPAIEQYVAWLAERGYAARNVLHRVPLLVRFGEFARAQGATTVEELPAHVGPFVATRVREAGRRGGTATGPGQARRDVRGPVEQLLRLVVPGFTGPGRPRQTEPPFARQAPGFFDSLRTERGLRPATLRQYRHHLLAFEAYLARIRLATLADLSPPLLSAFVGERRARGLARMTVRARCGILRVFLRYLHRENLVPADLSRTVEGPQAYRLATVPRALPWGDVGRVLETVDRRSGCGQRDYALLLLLITYGLRAREVAALTLEDLDWKRERLRLPERKAGHAAAFRLSPVVGEALVEYLRHGRPATAERHVFCRAMAPVGPITAAAVSARATHYLQRAGVTVPRPGSHTLRHTCAQRLVEADLPFPVIGGTLGHRVPAATAIYAKVAVETLREVALGAGEEVLA